MNLPEKIAEIVHCTSSCGSNADPADGFGYCTCGAKEKRTALLAAFEEVIGEDEPDREPTAESPEEAELEVAINTEADHNRYIRNKLRAELRKSIRGEKGGLDE